MTRAEFISQVKRRPALVGATDQIADDYVNRGLLAVSSFSPLRVHLLGVLADRDDGVYSVPEDARSVTGVFVSGTNAPITFEVKRKPDGRRELWLYSIRLPSAISLIDSPDYHAYYNNIPDGTVTLRPVFGGGSRGYDKYDLQYSANHTFDGLLPEHHLALEIYCDYLGYESRAAKQAERADITDRDPSGAQTMLRYSSSSDRFQKLMDMQMKQFKREMLRPYWTRSSFGIIERLWMDRSVTRDLYLD